MRASRRSTADCHSALVMPWKRLGWTISSCATRSCRSSRGEAAAGAARTSEAARSARSLIMPAEYIPERNILKTCEDVDVLTSTEAAVLGLLLEEGEQSGYDLSRQAARSVGYFWAPVQSRMYATLPRLVERGFARSREVVESNRLKQLYRITAAGKAALREWLHEPPEDQPDRNPLL